MHHTKFEMVKKSASKRKPPIKQSAPSASMKTSEEGAVARNAQILAANRISSDHPLNPRELATMRAEVLNGILIVETVRRKS